MSAIVGFDIRCPFCGDEITPELAYTSWTYSEHRDHVGYDCDGCDATWDQRGNVTRWPTSYSVERTLSRRANASVSAAPMTPEDTQ